MSNWKDPEVIHRIEGCTAGLGVSGTGPMHAPEQQQESGDLLRWCMPTLCLPCPTVIFTKIVCGIGAA